MRRPSRFGDGGRRALRAAIGSVSPRLLRSIRTARARRSYLREPTKGPRSILLEPTTGCNHRCVMCLDHSPYLGEPTPARHMAWEQVSRLLGDAAGMGTELIWLAGRGEPLAYERVGELFRLMKSLGLRSSVTTNGALLTDELAEELCGCGLAQISVSIDSGNSETHARVHGARAGERERILGVMQRLSRRKDTGLRVVTSMVVSKPNHAELLDFVRDGIAAGVSEIVVGGMRPVPFDSAPLALTEENWARVRADLEEARRLASQAGVGLSTDNIPSGRTSAPQPWPYDEMACFIGHMFATVDVEGNVHGCCTCQNRLGALGEESFLEIWRGRAYQSYRRLLRELPVSGETPPRCDCRYACGHVPDNRAVQEEVGFRFGKRSRGSGFATRLDLAGALGSALFGPRPAVEEMDGFADVKAEEAGEEMWAYAGALRRAGVLRGTGSMGGRPLFDPKRLVGRGEFVEVLVRALTSLGQTTERSKEIAAAACGQPERPSEPLTKRDLKEWVGAAAALVGARKGG